jgi:GDP-L-fucose synthase
MKHYSDESFLNVGSGQDISVGDFARLVTDVVGYQGKLVFDTSRPDGVPRKLLDVSKLTALGWRAKTSLREGLSMAYADFLAGGGRLRD